MKNFYFTGLISLSTLIIGVLIGYILFGGLFYAPPPSQQVLAADNGTDTLDEPENLTADLIVNENGYDEADAYISGDLSSLNGEASFNNGDLHNNGFDTTGFYDDTADYGNMDMFGLDNVENGENTNTDVGDGERITDETIIVYEYYFLADGVTETTEELPPKFLIDKTEFDLRTALDGWIIVKFGVDEVVVRKFIDGRSSQYYIVGIYDGHVAVFYDGGLSEETEGAIKEVTSMPVSALNDSEIKRLEQGIRVTGDEELFRLLQDYGS